MSIGDELPSPPCFWPPEAGKNDRDLPEDEHETVADGLFHIGQGGEKKAVETVRCLTCGSKKFHVGLGEYFTGIKCVKCGWERCVHDG